MDGLTFVSQIPSNALQILQALTQLIEVLKESRDQKDEVYDNLEKDKDDLEDVLQSLRKDIKNKDPKDVTPEEMKKAMKSLSEQQQENLRRVYDSYTGIAVAAEDFPEISKRLTENNIPHFINKHVNMDTAFFFVKKEDITRTESIGRRYGIELTKQINKLCGFLSKEDFLDKVMKDKNASMDKVICLKNIPSRNLPVIEDELKRLGIAMGKELMTTQRDDGIKYYNVYYNVNDILKVERALLKSEFKLKSDFNIVFQKAAEYDDSINEKINMALLTDKEVCICSEVMDEYMIIRKDKIEAYSKGKLQKSIERSDDNTMKWMQFVNRYAKGMKNIYLVKLDRFEPYKDDFKKRKKELFSKAKNSKLDYDFTSTKMTSKAYESLSETKFITDLLEKKLGYGTLDKDKVQDLSEVLKKRESAKTSRDHILKSVSQLLKSYEKIISPEVINGDSKTRHESNEEYDKRKEEFIEEFKLTKKEQVDFFSKLEQTKKPNKIKKIDNQVNLINKAFNSMEVGKVQSLDQEIAMTQKIVEKERDMANKTIEDSIIL